MNRSGNDRVFENMLNTEVSAHTNDTVSQFIQAVESDTWLSTEQLNTLQKIYSEAKSVKRARKD